MKSARKSLERHQRWLLVVYALVPAVIGAGWLALTTMEQKLAGAAAMVGLLAVLGWALRRLKIEWARVATSEGQLAATLRSIGDAVITTDSQCRVQTMNLVAEEYTGRTEQEARGKRLNEILFLVDRESGEFLTNSFNRVLQAHTTVQLPRNSSLRSADGTERMISCTGTPIRDDYGQTLGAVIVLHDSTEEALAQAALHASQMLFRQITENVTDVITVHDLDGRRVFQSQLGQGLIRPLDSTNSDGFIDIAEEDRDRVKEIFATLVRTGEPARSEYRWITPDGRKLTIESIASLIRDQQKRAEKVLVISRDVTDRRESEQRLKAEVDFTESILKGLPGIFILCDEEFRLLRWNRNFEVVTGLASGELVALDLLTVVAPADHDLLRQRARHCFEDDKMDLEVRLLNRNGRTAAYYLSGLRISLHGRPAMLGIGIDISARKAAEETLLATSARLDKQNAALGEQARNPVLRQQDLDSAFRAITEMAARTLSLSRASIWFYDESTDFLRCADLYERPSGRHSSGLTLKRSEYPTYFESLAEGRVIPAHYARNDPRTREFTEIYLKPLGITSMLDAPIRSDGRLIGVICHEHTGMPREWALDEQNFAGSMADLVALSLEVSQRRQAEQALRETLDSLEMKVAERTSELSEANERLKEVDRLKSEFLATMSHELRTPLNSIIGFTGILRQGLAGPLNEEQKKQLGMVNFSAKHLLSLINDLLDLSRIESGRMEVHHETFRVSEVVGEVTQSLQPLVARKKLQLTTFLETPDLEIHSDRKKTFQILLNLANNAVKFTEKGEIRIAVATDETRVCFEVTDTGIGIKPEQMNHLFQAFRQIDGSARRIFEGTGLGLYLCKKLVTILGGTIGVESVFGTGSCFHFTLPRQANHAS